MGTFGLFTAFSFRHSRVCRKVPPAEPASFNEEWNAALKRLLRNPCRRSAAHIYFPLERGLTSLH